MMMAIISGEARFRNIPAEGSMTAAFNREVPGDRFFQISPGEGTSLLAGLPIH
jgi:hypothetical protein